MLSHLPVKQLLLDNVDGSLKSAMRRARALASRATGSILTEVGGFFRKRERPPSDGNAGSQNAVFARKQETRKGGKISRKSPLGPGSK